MGLFTDDVTYHIGVQLAPLLEDKNKINVYDKSSKKSARRLAKGDLKQYNDLYRALRKTYRRTYTPKQLKNLGFLPYTNGGVEEITEGSLLQYIQTTYDSTATSITSFRYDDLPTNDELALYNLQQEPLFTVSTQSYDFMYDSGVGAVLTTFIFVKGQIAGGAFEAKFAYFDNVNLIVVYDFVSPLNQTLLTELSVIVKYKSGSVVKYYVESMVTASSLFTVTSVLDMTSIIPLKVDNVVLPGTHSKNKFLSTLGLDYSSLLPAITQDSVHSSYVLSAITLEYDPYLQAPNQKSLQDKVLYDTLNIYYDIGGGKTDPSSGGYVDKYSKVSISTTAIDFKYNLYIKKLETVGSGYIPDTFERAVGANISTIRFSTRIFTKYLTETTKVTFEVGGYVEYKIGPNTATKYYPGSGTSTDPNIPSGDYSYDKVKPFFRLILPLTVLNSLNYKELLVIHKTCLVLGIYTSTEIVTKWYQKGVFKYAFIIGALVVGYFTGTLPLVIKGLITSFAIGEALKYLIIEFDLPPWLSEAVQLAYIAYEIWNGDFQEASEFWFKIADGGIKVKQLANSIEQQNLIDDIEQDNIDNEELAKRIKEVSDQWTDEEKTAFRPIETALYQPQGNRTTEQFVYDLTESTVTQIDTMFNLDIIIQKKKEVYSGF